MLNKQKLKKMWKLMAKPLYFAAYLGVLGMFVTAVAAFGYNLAAPEIEENRQDKIRETVALLFSEEDGYVTNLELPANSYQQFDYDLIDDVYEVSKDGELYAVIYDMKVQGRNGIINALIAVDPYTDIVVAAVYYNHSETPDKGEVYARDERIEEIVGDSVTEVQFDQLAGATTTWNALRKMYDEIEKHYVAQEVHING